AGREPRQSERDALIRGRTGCRRREREEGGTRTRRTSSPVVDAIGREVCERASICIRSRRSPHRVQDGGAPWIRRQEDCAQYQTENQSAPHSRDRRGALRVPHNDPFESKRYKLLEPWVLGRCDSSAMTECIESQCHPLIICANALSIVAFQIRETS